MTRTAIAVGSNHCAFVDADGKLLTCGNEEVLDTEEGQSGYLGLGQGVHGAVVPTVVQGLGGVRVHSVSLNDAHSLVISTKGACYSWGKGSCGRLGHGDEEDQLTPRLVEALRGVVVFAVAAGEAHSLAVDESGWCYSFGKGSYGELGHGDRRSHVHAHTHLFTCCPSATITAATSIQSPHLTPRPSLPLPAPPHPSLGR